MIEKFQLLRGITWPVLALFCARSVGSWKGCELEALRARDFTLATSSGRLEKLGDPWGV